MNHSRNGSLRHERDLRVDYSSLAEIDDPASRPSSRTLATLAAHRRARRRRIVLLVVGSLAVLGLAAALGGCACAEVRDPAKAIAKDLELYRGLVAPASTLTVTQAAMVNELGRKLQANTERLAEASK